MGYQQSHLNLFPKLRQKEVLHKPIQDIRSLLEEIKSFNSALYLCCLFTYGCLLRPHREVRELKWGDFSENLKYISLSGNRSKSGRNRVVPVPEYIRSLLKPNKAHFNVFSSCETPLLKTTLKVSGIALKSDLNFWKTIKLYIHFDTQELLMFIKEQVQ